LDIINGYAVDRTRFEGNNRLRTVRFITDDRSIRRELKNSMRWQMIQGSFGVTTALTIEIDSVYYGNHWNDAALTEIRFWKAST
jgi:hypothetical protein